MHLLQALANKPDTSLLNATATTLSLYIALMKNGKAADIFGITTEHIKYASSEITEAIGNMIEGIVNMRKIPDIMKIGLVTPVLKKATDHSNPDSYRHITRSSHIGKICEKSIMAATKPIL